MSAIEKGHKYFDHLIMENGKALDQDEIVRRLREHERMDLKTYLAMQDMCKKFAENVNFSGNKPLTPIGQQINAVGQTLIEGGDHE